MLTAIKRVFATEKERMQMQLNLARQGDAKAQYHVGKDIESDPVKALDWIRKAATQGLAEAQDYLGHSYEYGLDVEEDSAQAFEWYRRAALQGLDSAQDSISWCYEYGRGVQQNTAQAYEWRQRAALQRKETDIHATKRFEYLDLYFYLEHTFSVMTWKIESIKGITSFDARLKLANEGNVEAQNYVGWQYHTGFLIPKNLIKAYEWFQKAAQKSVNAKYNLALCYANGWGIKQDSKKAFDLFNELAFEKECESLAQYHLGLCYEEKRGVESDIHMHMAIHKYEEAAKLGHTLAQYRLGLHYEEKLDHAKAFGWYQKAAREHLSAQYRLGICYENGIGTKKSIPKAFEQYQKPAKQGMPLAQYHLGLCFEEGRGIKPDFARACEWYEQAANQRMALAQYRLGRCYEEGRGVQQDFRKAFEWYEKAAKQKVAAAQYHCGRCYEEGQGVKADSVKAFEYYTKSAEQGEPRAQYNLGLCYFHGKGVKPNIPKAFEWFEKAEKQGEPRAQFYLGQCYEYGNNGFKKDFLKAFQLYEKAALQGSAQAQVKLASCYEEGKGVKKDFAKALEWYQKAALQNKNHVHHLTRLTTNHPHLLVAPANDTPKTIIKDEKQSNTATGISLQNNFTAEEEYTHGLGYQSLQKNDLDAKGDAKAFVCFQKAALRGLAAAQFSLGNCYVSGTGVKQDAAEGFEWIQKAAMGGFAEAQFSLGCYYASDNKYVQKDLVKSFKWSRRAARQRFAKAQYYLGQCYEQGKGVERNLSKAIEWCQKAALQDDDWSIHYNLKRLTEAQAVRDKVMSESEAKIDKMMSGKMTHVASLYSQYDPITGEVIDSLSTTAVTSVSSIAITSSASSEDIDDMNLQEDFKDNLAITVKDEKQKNVAVTTPASLSATLSPTGTTAMYQSNDKKTDDTDIQKDSKENNSWKGMQEDIPLAEAGDAEAQVRVGLAYEINDRPTEAFEWYEKAAIQGFNSAQYALGNCYENGRGVAPDQAQAFKWYKKAAQRGHNHAQYLVAQCYENGDMGVQVNLVKALKWYEQAAEQMNKAQYIVGQFYENGRGVQKDPAKAFKYYNKALSATSFSDPQHTQYRLAVGRCYEYGIGVPQNLAEALQWYSIDVDNSEVRDNLKRFTELYPHIAVATNDTTVETAADAKAEIHVVSSGDKKEDGVPTASTETTVSHQNEIEDGDATTLEESPKDTLSAERQHAADVSTVTAALPVTTTASLQPPTAPVLTIAATTLTVTPELVALLHELKNTGLEGASIRKLNQLLTTWSDAGTLLNPTEVKEALNKIQKYLGRLDNQLSLVNDKLELDPTAQREQTYIDKEVKLANYQRKLQQELSKFITAYFLATTGVFKLGDNKKGLILSALSDAPFVGTFLKLFIAGLQRANTKHQCYEINKLIELFTDIAEIQHAILRFSRQLTLAKEKEIKSQATTEPKPSTVAEELRGFYEAMKDAVYKEWRNLKNSDGAGLTFKAEEKLALLDAAFLLEKILSGEAKFATTTKDLAVVPHFLRIAVRNPKYQYSTPTHVREPVSTMTTAAVMSSFSASAPPSPCSSTVSPTSSCERTPSPTSPLSPVSVEASTKTEEAKDKKIKELEERLAKVEKERQLEDEKRAKMEKEQQQKDEKNAKQMAEMKETLDKLTEENDLSAGNGNQAQLFALANPERSPHRQQYSDENRHLLFHVNDQVHFLSQRVASVVDQINNIQTTQQQIQSKQSQRK